jgi:hypothetical protein
MSVTDCGANSSCHQPTDGVTGDGVVSSSRGPWVDVVEIHPPTSRFCASLTLVLQSGGY